MPSPQELQKMHADALNAIATAKEKKDFIPLENYLKEIGKLDKSEQGAQLYQVDGNGYNILHYLAANKGYPDANEEAGVILWNILTEFDGGDIYKKANNGLSPIDVAAKSGNQEAIRQMRDTLTSGSEQEKVFDHTERPAVDPDFKFVSSRKLSQAMESEGPDDNMSVTNPEVMQPKSSAVQYAAMPPKPKSSAVQYDAMAPVIKPENKQEQPAINPMILKKQKEEETRLANKEKGAADNLLQTEKKLFEYLRNYVAETERRQNQKQPLSQQRQVINVVAKSILELPPLNEVGDINAFRERSKNIHEKLKVLSEVDPATHKMIVEYSRQMDPLAQVQKEISRFKNMAEMEILNARQAVQPEPVVKIAGLSEERMKELSAMTNQQKMDFIIGFHNLGFDIRNPSMSPREVIKLARASGREAEDKVMREMAEKINSQYPEIKFLAQNGNMFAQYALAKEHFWRDDNAAGKKWLELAAGKGHGQSMLDAAIYSAEGKKGFAPAEARAKFNNMLTLNVYQTLPDSIRKQAINYLLEHKNEFKAKSMAAHKNSKKNPEEKTRAEAYASLYELAKSDIVRQRHNVLNSSSHKDSMARLDEKKQSFLAKQFESLTKKVDKLFSKNDAPNEERKTRKP